MARRMLVRLALAQFLAMTLWFSATAVTPALVATFRMTTGEAAWLTMAVQAGFVAGTLVTALFSLPDLINARYLFAIGCLVGAAANAGVARSTGALDAIVLRFVTGVALACVYPPGMKIVAGWFEGRRGTALGILIGALTIGSAFPHLLAVLSANLSWRLLVLTSSGMALAGGALVALTVRDGPYVTASAPFDPRAALGVFTNRGTRLATYGYLGHMWELYAVWTWMEAFAAASLGTYAAAHAGVRPGPGAGSLAAFVAIGSGAFGAAFAGVAADRLGRARVASWAMLASATCALLSGFVFGAAPGWLYGLLVVWGVAVVADSAQFSALVAEYSPRDHVGTALTVQTCAGFLLTMVSIRLLPAAAQVVGWQWSFVVLVPGPLLGTVAMRRLSRPPRAAARGPAGAVI
ncbi:MAG TPA: MFS transporter [Vicinamibacterales bacterium]|nr:MFS transporter [Vicinamibacterales bacterium]